MDREAGLLTLWLGHVYTSPDERRAPTRDEQNRIGRAEAQFAIRNKATVRFKVADGGVTLEVKEDGQFVPVPR